MFGLIAPVLVILAGGSILGDKDNKRANWKFLLLLLYNTAFTLISRFFSSIELSPRWVYKHKIITCFVVYGVLGVIILVYSMRLRGWDRNRMYINYQKRIREREEVEKTLEQSYKDHKILDENIKLSLTDNDNNKE